VKNDVTNFFATRGVSRDNDGMFGGMTYENPANSEVDDSTFIAQQLKWSPKRSSSAEERERRIELEANATARKARREAMGPLADARKTTGRGPKRSDRAGESGAQRTGANPMHIS